MSLLFIDTETTGLPRSFSAPTTDGSAWPRVVQVAWIVTDEHAQVLKQVSTLVRPEGFTIPIDATRIHGITTERALAEGAPLRDVLEELAVDLATAQRFIAHNVDFDRPVLQAEYHRVFGEEPLSRMSTFCTMRESTQLVGIMRSHGAKWPRLAELHRHLFGTDFASAHDASADVAACMRCYFALIERGEARAA